MASMVHRICSLPTTTANPPPSYFIYGRHISNHLDIPLLFFSPKTDARWLMCLHISCMLCFQALSVRIYFTIETRKSAKRDRSPTHEKVNNLKLLTEHCLQYFYDTLTKWAVRLKCINNETLSKKFLFLTCEYGVN